MPLQRSVDARNDSAREETSRMIASNASVTSESTEEERKGKKRYKTTEREKATSTVSIREDRQQSSTPTRPDRGVVL